MSSYYGARGSLSRAERDGYPYFAETSTSTRMSKGKGDCKAYCTRYQKRTWAFPTIVARDKFVDTYGATRVFSNTERAVFRMPPTYNY